MILGDDHSKMSKSKGNVVNPDVVIESHGADALRLYEMFMGPLESEKPWSTESLNGAKKFLDRVWRMFDFDIVAEEVKDLRTLYHQTVKKVTDDYEKLAFNTAISQMMIFVNEVYKTQKISKDQARGFLKLLNPIAPHMTEEINQSILKQNILHICVGNSDKILLYPHRVVHLEGKLRIVGEDVGDQSLITFDMDLIRNLKLADQDYRPNYTVIEVNEFINGFREVSGNEIRLILKIQREDEELDLSLDDLDLSDETGSAPQSSDDDTLSDLDIDLELFLS